MNDNLKFEQLEERRLLAVSVTTGKQGLLKITGDGDGDVVEVDGTGNFGEVDVWVNGSFEGTFAGVKTIKAAMKGGDDELHLSAIQIGGAVDVDMGAGDDLFDVDTLATGGEGFFAGNVFIGGAVIAKLGNNTGDLVQWETDIGGEGLGITIGNNVTLQGAADVNLDGEGGDSGVQNDDINIGGFLKISSNVANDIDGDGHTVHVDDVNVGGTTILALNGADDDVLIEDSNFARRVAASLGAGDDDLEVRNSSFAADVVANGGKGDDFLDASVGNDFAVEPVVNGFETVAI